MNGDVDALVIMIVTQENNIRVVLVKQIGSIVLDVIVIPADSGFP